MFSGIYLLLILEGKIEKTNEKFLLFIQPLFLSFYNVSLHLFLERSDLLFVFNYFYFMSKIIFSFPFFSLFSLYFLKFTEKE